MARAKGIDPARIVELRRQGLSIVAIGRRLGVTRQTVWSSLQRHGSEADKQPKPKLGTEKGFRVNASPEQVAALRRSGKSLRQIADLLEIGYTTARRLLVAAVGVEQANKFGRMRGKPYGWHEDVIARIQAGESAESIARSYQTTKKTIYALLHRHKLDTQGRPK